MVMEAHDSPEFMEVVKRADLVTPDGMPLMWALRRLGFPKQEEWMYQHKNKIEAVMIGVGAAFDFHAGVKPQAPAWMQKRGLEWLYDYSTNHAVCGRDTCIIIRGSSY